MGGTVSTPMGDDENLKRRESAGDIDVYGRVIFNKALK
jgi:hypothetical protein